MGPSQQFFGIVCVLTAFAYLNVIQNAHAMKGGKNEGGTPSRAQTHKKEKRLKEHEAGRETELQKETKKTQSEYEEAIKKVSETEKEWKKKFNEKIEATEKEIKLKMSETDQKDKSLGVIMENIDSYLDHAKSVSKEKREAQKNAQKKYDEVKKQLEVAEKELTAANKALDSADGQQKCWESIKTKVKELETLKTEPEQKERLSKALEEPQLIAKEKGIVFVQAELNELMFEELLDLSRKVHGNNTKFMAENIITQQRYDELANAGSKINYLNTNYFKSGQTEKRGKFQNQEHSQLLLGISDFFKNLSNKNNVEEDYDETVLKTYNERIALDSLKTFAVVYQNKSRGKEEKEIDQDIQQRIKGRLQCNDEEAGQLICWYKQSIGKAISRGETIDPTAAAEAAKKASGQTKGGDQTKASQSKEDGSSSMPNRGNKPRTANRNERPTAGSKR